jgi:hypothetical protein
MASFNIMIGTSSTLGTLPPVMNPCGGTTSSSDGVRKPVLAVYLPSGTPRRGGRFPALVLLTLSFPIGLFVVLSRVTPGKLAPLAVAVAGLTALILTGCGSSGVGGIATPVGTYTLTVTGNALNASGDALNASRAVTFTVDVVAPGT